MSSLISGSVVVDELCTTGGNVSWILVPGDGCDVGVLVSTGRIGTTEDGTGRDTGTVGSGSTGTVVDVVVDSVVVVAGSVVVVAGSVVVVEVVVEGEVVDVSSTVVEGSGKEVVVVVLEITSTTGSLVVVV